MKKNYIHKIMFSFLLASFALVSFAGETDQEKKDQNTPAGWPAVSLPQLPVFTDANTFVITDYGASTASADNTAAIQTVLDNVPAKGGKVIIPKGTFLCGPVEVKSKTVIHLAAGATLKLLPYGKYPEITQGTRQYDNFISTGKQGGKNPFRTDIVVEGEDKNTSIIDGQGEAWWKAYEQSKDMSRGAVIRFRNGERFLVRNLTIKNAPGVNITISQNGKASNGTIHDVIIRNPSSTATTGVKSHNTDGISIWGPNVNIYNCDISTGDDNVVVDTDGSNIHVWNCTFGDGHGASIGSYTTNVHDVLYEGITFNGTESAIRIKSQRGRGGDVYNVTYQNCTIKNSRNPIYVECWYDQSVKPEPSKAPEETANTKTPKFHTFLFKNITSTGTAYDKSAKANFPIYIYGLPESKVTDVVFDNVQVQAQKGMFLAYCDVEFKNNCKITNTKSSQTYFATKYEATLKGDYTAVEPINADIKTAGAGKYYGVDGKYYGTKAKAGVLNVCNGKKFVAE